VRSRISASEARQQAALATWEQTVALAIEETESALSAYTRSAQQTAKLESAARYAEEAARLARIRFEAGASDFLTVLDAERSVLAARDALVQAQAGTVGSLVGVYRALGGGWAVAR
jgi:outer membrane protein TolC